MPHDKKKASAAAHAQDRAQRENHLAEAPPTTRSNKAVDQDRAVAESPLHGEDRPVGKRGEKQDRPSGVTQQTEQTTESSVRQNPGTHIGKRNVQ